jgi:hypothetical protein
LSGIPLARKPVELLLEGCPPVGPEPRSVRGKWVGGKVSAGMSLAGPALQNEIDRAESALRSGNSTQSRKHIDRAHDCISTQLADISGSLQS